MSHSAKPFSSLVGSFVLFLLRNNHPQSMTVALSVSPQQPSWKPKVASLEERQKLRGKQHESELIGTSGFHHVEFYCGDAKSTAYRFALALGMQITGETGQSTGNDKCVSYGLESDNVRFLITAPYSIQAGRRVASSNAADDDDDAPSDAPNPLPGFDPEKAHSMFAQHGLFARAVAVECKDAKLAFDQSVEQGAHPVVDPVRIESSDSRGCMVAEVQLYDDVVLRYVSFDDPISSDTPQRQPFLPHLAPVEGKIATRATFGIQRIDHAVGNVPDLLQALNRIQTFTGFHEFAEFTSEDVGTVESGLNSVVLASDTEDVLLPINEPTSGKRKSQIQTYLEQNEGAGLQHLALKTGDVFATIRKMKDAEENMGGFELMKRPSDAYYRELPDRLGDQLTQDQYNQLEELGILADADDEGILLQVFTKPIGDRPTFFFEIIQRIGCRYKPKNAEIEVERAGCGGFGQGNFKELFRSIEEHEKTLKV